MREYTKYLYALELDVSIKEGPMKEEKEHWVIHQEYDADRDCYCLCVFENVKDAEEATMDRDHSTRIVRFVREEIL